MPKLACLGLVFKKLKCSSLGIWHLKNLKVYQVRVL